MTSSTRAIEALRNLSIQQDRFNVYMENDDGCAAVKTSPGFFYAGVTQPDVLLLMSSVPGRHVSTRLFSDIFYRRARDHAGKVKFSCPLPIYRRIVVDSGRESFFVLWFCREKRELLHFIAIGLN